jgi:glutamyl-tRNA reductase
MMNIYMTGIDYQRTGLEEREAFTFTSASLIRALEQVSSQYPQTGCVLISTCNRTELWISETEDLVPEHAAEPEWRGSPLEHLLLELKGYSPPACHGLFVHRHGTDAVAISLCWPVD